MRTGRQARFSLRGLSLLSTVSFGLLVLVLAVGLLLASRLIWRSALAAERDTEAIVLTGQVALTLREYERLGDLAAGADQPAVGTIRSELEARLHSLLLEMEPHAGSEAESRLLATLSALVETYLAEREALEARGLPVAEVVRASRPSLERALETSLALRAQNEKDLRETQREARELLRLQSLWSASSVEAGQLKLKLEEFDLRDAARIIVDLYGPTTSDHPIQLDMPDEPVMVRGDSLRIEQVISNLVSNAIKYSPRGGPVAVRIGATEDTAELAVTDRGLGIPPDEIPELFTPFRRRLGIPESIPGTGLGLAIVQRIVEAHQGCIDVESTLGAGSTFRVRLPLLAR